MWFREPPTTLSRCQRLSRCCRWRRTSPSYSPYSGLCVYSSKSVRKSFSASHADFQSRIRSIGSKDEACFLVEIVIDIITRRTGIQGQLALEGIRTVRLILESAHGERWYVLVLSQRLMSVRARYYSYSIPFYPIYRSTNPHGEASFRGTIPALLTPQPFSSSYVTSSPVYEICPPRPARVYFELWSPACHPTSRPRLARHTSRTPTSMC